MLVNLFAAVCIKEPFDVIWTSWIPVRSESSGTHYYASFREKLNFLFNQEETISTGWFLFFGEHSHESFVENSVFSPHSTVCAKYDRRETCLVTTENTFVLWFLFLFLVHLIAFGKALSFILSSSRVKKPYIKKCFLKSRNLLH